MLRRAWLKTKKTFRVVEGIIYSANALYPSGVIYANFVGNYFDRDFPENYMIIKDEGECNIDYVLAGKYILPIEEAYRYPHFQPIYFDTRKVSVEGAFTKEEFIKRMLTKEAATLIKQIYPDKKCYTLHFLKRESVFTEKIKVKL